jgi:hypothetical protein
MKKTNGNDDFKYTFLNLQHQDHNITTNDDTSSKSLGFPYKTFKGVKNGANFKKLRKCQKSLLKFIIKF